MDRRRRAGHLGVFVTLAALIVLLAAHVPPGWRLVVGLPAAIAAVGYLQAWLQFCVAFGAGGIFNFGPVGRTEKVQGPSNRSRDRARAWEILITSLTAGVVVGVVAYLLPV